MNAILQISEVIFSAPYGTLADIKPIPATMPVRTLWDLIPWQAIIELLGAPRSLR